MPTLRDLLIEQLDTNPDARVLLNASKWPKHDIRQTVVPTERVLQRERKKSKWGDSSRRAYSRDSLPRLPHED